MAYKRTRLNAREAICLSRSPVAPGCCTCARGKVAAEAKATERGRVAHGPRGAPASVPSPGGGSSGCSQHPRARRPPRSGGLRGLGRVRQRAGQPGAMAVAVRARGALRGLAALGGRGASRAAMVSAAGAGERACGGEGTAARAPPRLPRVTSTERRAHARAPALGRQRLEDAREFEASHGCGVAPAAKQNTPSNFRGSL